MHDRDAARRAIAHEHHLADAAVSAVGMPLGMWAGRGDYATIADAARDKAGVRALAELDAAIVELTAVREHLAVVLTSEQDTPAVDSDTA